jgi:hypothetical protein
MAPDRLEPGFVREGRFFALPLAVPGECDPIDPDASRLSALALSGDGCTVYATTGGSACHVVQAALLGPVGLVQDLGTIPDATALTCLAAIAADKTGDLLLVGARHAGGSRLWLGHTAHQFDTVQEPTLTYPDFSVAADLPGTILLDCTRDNEGSLLLLSDRGLARWALGHGLEWLIDDPRRFADVVPRLLPLPNGGAAWIAGDGTVGTWDGSTAGSLGRLPCAPGAGTTACATSTGIAVFSGDGETWSVGRDGVRALGRTVLAPVAAAAALADGRLLACCGEGIAHLDCFEPSTGRWRDLGAIVTTLPQPRYGLTFSAILAGTQGELWLAEHDRGGCLWLYHPCWPAPTRTP